MSDRDNFLVKNGNLFDDICKQRISFGSVSDSGPVVSLVYLRCFVFVPIFFLLSHSVIGKYMVIVFAASLLSSSNLLH